MICTAPRTSTRTHLAAHPPAKDAVDEGGVGHLGRGLGLHVRDAGLMHGIQQGDEELVRVFLPAQPEAAG